MAFDVRTFGFRGLAQIPIINQLQFSADSIYQLVYPYEWVQRVTTAGAVAVSTTARPAGDRTVLVMIEVPDNQIIRFEINPPGRAVAASINSPSLAGRNNFYFQQGWTLSVVDAAAV